MRATRQEEFWLCGGSFCQPVAGSAHGHTDSSLSTVRSRRPKERSLATDGVSMATPLPAPLHRYEAAGTQSRLSCRSCGARAGAARRAAIAPPWCVRVLSGTSRHGRLCFISRVQGPEMSRRGTGSEDKAVIRIPRLLAPDFRAKKRIYKGTFLPFFSGHLPKHLVSFHLLCGGGGLSHVPNI